MICPRCRSNLLYGKIASTLGFILDERPFNYCPFCAAILPKVEQKNLNNQQENFNAALASFKEKTWKIVNKKLFVQSAETQDKSTGQVATNLEV